MKIAIVGTGIAGNIIAARLRDNHDITVYEASDYIGGHSNTVSVATPEGELALDTGFIVFNDRTYPNFVALLKQLGVSSQPSEMSFSVSDVAAGLEYNGSSINTLFAQRRNLLRPSFYRMIRDILRFNREAPELLADFSTRVSLGDYLRGGRYSREFTNHYLMPMGAAIWSAKPDEMARMPAAFFVRFFLNHGLLSLKDRPQWQVISGGSRSYVEKLTAAHKKRVRLMSPVRRVARTPAGVLLKTDATEAESYDYVFLACHSDQALAILHDALPAEHEVLGAIPYQRNDAVLHTDRTLMPKRMSAWAAWNYHTGASADDRAELTYFLNRLQGLSTEEDYFVTLNSMERINPKKVIRTIAYDHPVFNADSVAAQARQAEINGLDRVYFCGAYWRSGFHEDGVVSALNALEHFRNREENEKRDLQRTG